MMQQGRVASLPATGWLATLRIAVGIIWLLESSLKLNPYYLTQGFVAEVTDVMAQGNPFPWYVALLQQWVMPHPTLFAYLKAFGELAVGLALTFGFLTTPAAIAGIFMNLNFFLGAGWIGSVHYTMNLLMMVLQAGFIAFRAGRFLGFEALLAWNPGETAAGAPAGASANSPAAAGIAQAVTILSRTAGICWLWSATDLLVLGSPGASLRFLATKALNSGYDNPFADWLRDGGWLDHPTALGLLLLAAQVAAGAALLSGRTALWTIPVALFPAAFFFLLLGPGEYLQYFYYLLMMLAQTAAVLMRNQPRAIPAPTL